mgnify:CR=1 FL=1
MMESWWHNWVYLFFSEYEFYLQSIAFASEHNDMNRTAACVYFISKIVIKNVFHVFIIVAVVKYKCEKISQRKYFISNQVYWKKLYLPAVSEGTHKNKFPGFLCDNDQKESMASCYPWLHSLILWNFKKANLFLRQNFIEKKYSATIEQSHSIHLSTHWCLNFRLIPPQH